MKRTTLLFSLLVAVLFTITSSCQKNDGWVDLFNGKDLSGWKKVGGNGTYEVVNGEIVGTSMANELLPSDPAEIAKMTIEDFPKNTFLTTEKAYSDFIIELELKFGNMNGGIQFRSHSDPDYLNGLFHGYQCEVDPSERAWSAGIYDEMGRAWLYPVTFNPPARSAIKLNDWNLYRIECIGSSMRTWLNGVPVAHLIDDKVPEGHFGLQVHFTFKEEQVGEQIFWRNIRIKTENLTPAPPEGIFIANYIPNNLSAAEAAQGWKLLFDGKSATSLKSRSSGEFPDNGWEIADGMLAGISEGEEATTPDQYSAFDLQFEFKTEEGAKGGISYFSGSEVPGLEYSIVDSDTSKTAMHSASVRGLMHAAPVPKHPANLVPTPWNRGRITADADGKVAHWLNGTKLLEYERGSEEFAVHVAKSEYADIKDFGLAEQGPITFKVDRGAVHFRSMKIKEIK